MTSLVEAANIHSWDYKHNYNGEINNFSEIGSHRDSKIEMLDIPSWNQEPMSKRSADLFQDTKKTCVFDSAAISPVVIDSNCNDVKPLKEPSKCKSNFLKEEKIRPSKSETSACSVISSKPKMNTDTLPSENNRDKTDVKSGIESSHLKHVHSNPFFKKLGVDHPHGNVYQESEPKNLSNGISPDDDSDIHEEYAPNSGFVNKLRQKFSKLTSSSVKLKSSRKYASLESLIDIGKVKNEVNSPFVKNNFGNNTHDDQGNTVSVGLKSKRSAPQPPKQRPRIASADVLSNDSLTISKTESKLSSDFHYKVRDDIVIIENEQPPQQKSPRELKSTEQVESGSIKPIKDNVKSTDLPKPNTVVNFRSLFEKRVSNTQKLPDFYASKFNLNKGKLPPKPPLPPRRSSQDLRTVIDKVKDESIASENVEKSIPVTQSDAEKSLPVSSEAQEKDKDMVESAPGQSVKDLSQLFKAKPERPFESPKSKRRSPEKKAIFDSSVITPTPNEVKEEPIVKSIKDKKEETVHKSASLDKPVAPVRKPERSNKPRMPSYVSPNTGKPVYTSKVRSSGEGINKTKIEAKSTDSNISKSTPTNNSLFPNRKQIFDSQAIVENNSTTPVAPPRVKQQKRSVEKNNTPKIENKEKINEKEKIPASPTQSSLDLKKDKTEIKPSVKDNDTETSASNKLSIEEINERNRQKEKEAEKRLIEIEQSSSKLEKSKPEERNEIGNSNSNTPVRGVPSIIAKRLNKVDNKVNLGSRIIPLDSAKDDSSDEEHEPRLIKPSHLRSTKSSSPNVPNKNNDTSSSNSLNFKNVLKSAKNDQVPKTNIDDLIRGKRNKKPAAVFDSSAIAVSPSKPATNGVPPLNLSDLVNDKKQDHPYQEGYIPTKIEPCNYVFEGAGVKMKTTPLMKRRQQKGKITFHEDPKLHEYQSEGAALKDYLEENPHEVSEAKKDEEASTLNLGGSLGEESSDDVDEPTTPREDSAIKSNTPLSHSTGELTNYKSKYQTQEFQFGMSFNEPEPEQKKEEPAEVPEEENMDFVPADEDSTINYTDSSISDMLF